MQANFLEVLYEYDFPKVYLPLMQEINFKLDTAIHLNTKEECLGSWQINKLVNRSLVVTSGYLVPELGHLSLKMKGNSSQFLLLIRHVGI